MKTLEIMFAKNRKTGNVRFSMSISLANAVLIAVLYSALNMAHPLADAHRDPRRASPTMKHHVYHRSDRAKVSRLAHHE